MLTLARAKVPFSTTLARAKSRAKIERAKIHGALVSTRDRVIPHVLGFSTPLARSRTTRRCACAAVDRHFTVKFTKAGGMQNRFGHHVQTPYKSTKSLLKGMNDMGGPCCI